MTDAEDIKENLKYGDHFLIYLEEEDIIFNKNGKNKGSERAKFLFR